MKVLMGMPLLNRERTMPNVLDALLNLDFPKKDLRLLFVDGFSTDRSMKILDEFREKNLREYRDVMIVQLAGNIEKAENYCINSVESDEYLWILDSDVYPTPNALNLLSGMATDFDMASLYYTHDRAKDPPPRTGIGPCRSVRMGCCLLSPKMIKVNGAFNEKLGEAPIDAEYCLRAEVNGLKIGFDADHVQLHDARERVAKWYFPIRETIVRRGHKGWWLREKVFTRRWLMDLALFISLLLMSISLLFGLPVLAYFIFQAIRKRRVADAFGLTINALIIPVASIIGYIELRLKGAGTVDTLQKKYSSKRDAED